MKEILQNIIEILFDKIPFSKKSEKVKSDIKKALEKLYEQKSNTANPIENLEYILSHASNLYQAGQLAGYHHQDIDLLKDEQNIKNEREVAKIFNRYKRYVVFESLFCAFIISLFINLICYFQTNTFIFNVIFSIILLVFILLFKKRRNQFIQDYQFFDIKCTINGKKYIQALYDKYTKKEINMIFLCFALISYIVFTNYFSYLTSAYTINDILQQISFSSSFIVLFIFLLLKIIRLRHAVASFFVDEKEKNVYIHLKKICIFCTIYWIVIITVLLLFKNIFNYALNWFLIATTINIIMLLIYNLTFRKNLVFQNLVVNIKRSIVISLSVFLLISYQVMSMDIWLIQPYIHTVSTIERTKDDITYNEDNGVYTITTNKQDFKVLQLTDIHLGGSAFSLSKDLKALKAVEKLITATTPDFVIVTGDLVFPMGVMSFSLNNRAPIMQFASFMRNIGIPWAFTYGNHDTEAMSVIDENQFDELMKSLSYRSSKNLLYPYIQPDIYGRSNQMIEIRHNDGTLMQALFLLDSNDYIPGGQLNEYDYIHDDQVNWYARQVRQLSQKEGYTIPSMLFFHIPLQEYKEAYELYESGSDEVQYYYGEIGETMIDKICSSKYPSKLFNTALELGSTKAMFCGHDHYNNLSVEYKGIRLTYGYSIDYLAMPGIEEDTKQRGATLITINKSGEYEIKPYRLIELE